MTMNEKIQHQRKKQGWTQEELAEKVGVSCQALSKWESGAAKPDVDNLVRLSALFGVTTDYLLKDDAEEQAPASAEKPRRREHAWMLVGAGLCGGLCALAGIVALGILSSFEICEVYRDGNPQPITGMWAYLEIPHLGWLFWLCAATAAAGLCAVAGAIEWSRRKKA